MKIHCPYCINGKMYEMGYCSWYDPKDKPKSLEELIDERDCSYCMGKEWFINKPEEV